MGYKSPGVLLEVVVIKREVKALVLNFACGKRGMFSHSLLGQDVTIQIQPQLSDPRFGVIILAIK